MRYFVTVGERTFEIGIDGDVVTVDGERVATELSRVAATPVRRLSVSDRSHRVIADPGDERGKWLLHIDGFPIEAEVVDDRTRAIRAMTAKSGVASGPKPVRAPMPGMIVRVEVAVGDQVKVGQGVVVVEAMKMENELKAETAGTVTKIHAVPGTAVEKGTILIEFAANG